MKNLDSLRVPKYVQLMFQLREQIETGNLKHGDPLPTREKLMREHGLSLSTVTRAISELERQGWLISRQGSGTFVVKRSESPKEAARENPVIGLLVPIARNDIPQFVSEFVHEAADNSINTLVMYSPEDEEAELNLARLLLEKDVKGLVWLPVEPKRHVSVASLFRKNKLPVILGEKVTEEFNIPWTCVRFDYHGGTMAALNHFLDQGHKRIAYVGPKGSEADFGPVPERWNAYKLIMKQRNLWSPDELIIPPSLFREWQMHVNRLETLFHRANAPTAILAFDDATALEAMRGLQAIGVRVPEDIAIIGHGDYSFGQYASPRLSTVAGSWSEYADAVIRALRTELAAAEGAGSPLSEREIVIPQRLIDRESSQVKDEMLAAG
ncbi:MAG TPA: GntR family transcriptional regulator [bacterium]|nr:GntR family transcriptional regulator [bacterium]